VLIWCCGVIVGLGVGVVVSSGTSSNRSLNATIAQMRQLSAEAIAIIEQQPHNPTNPKV
jgi:hypothetical protein